MSKPLPDSRIDQLIADYLADSLSDADRPVFEDWLRASPDHPRRVARLSATDYAIREVCQDTKADYLLDILNQIDDASGPAELVTLHHIDSGWRRYRLPFAIGGAIAAVLLIAVTLIITLQGPASVPSLATDTTTSNKPAASTQSTPRGSTVATLTAEHDAVWASPQAEGALAPGSALRAGTRLTLTQGFAEITTNRGAVAILEAPATIELLDNNNALRLHSGKLVGICETDSSKGFLVRTPHMDITDLGTRFGVAVGDNNQTYVRVLTGLVSVRGAQGDVDVSTPAYLRAGEIAGFDDQGRVAISESGFADLFSGLLSQVQQSYLPADGIRSLGGAIQWSATEPQRLPSPEFMDVRGDAVIYSELADHTLATDLQSDMHQPGTYRDFSTLEPNQIPSGTAIRSYVIAYRPEQWDRPTATSGQVAFNEEILGVIAMSESWNGFTRAIRPTGHPIFTFKDEVTYIGLRGDDEPAGDQIAISADRHILDFQFSGRRHGELVRVITRASKSVEDRN